MAALTFEGRWGFRSGPLGIGPIDLFDVGPLGITTASSLPVKLFFVQTANAPSTPYETAIDTTIKTVQTFYADQMAAHGYGRQTFDFNTTAGGQAEIEEVILPETYETYLAAAIEEATKTPENALFEIIQNDTTGRFSGNANLFFMGFPNFYIEDNIFRYEHLDGGTAWLETGNTVVYRTSRFSAQWSWRTAAHELGHVFGLLHDFSDNRYIMSYGANLRDRLSSASAAQLNNNRIFQSGLSTIYAFDNSVLRRFWPNGQRYSLPGTNAYGDVTWTFPTKPAVIPANFSNRGIAELLFHANEWYVLIRYQDPATQDSWYSLVKYNSAFASPSVVWNLDSGSKYYRDMKIDGSNIYLLSDQNEIETRGLTSGTQSSSFSTGARTTGFALTYNRIYAIQEGLIKAFDRSGVAVPADDTPTTNIQFLSTNFLPNGAGIIGDSLYFGGSTNAVLSNPQVFQFSGISQQPYSASWAPINYSITSRTIRSTLTLSEDPGGETAPGTDAAFSSIDDFQVEKRSGSTEPYTWTVASNWAILALGTGPRRVILANPATSVTNGYYRLVVKKDAFGIGKPATNINSSQIEVGSYVEPSTTETTRSYRAVWTAPIYNCTTRVIEATLALIEDPGSSFSVTNNFKVEKRSGSPGSYTWTEDTNWTFSSTEAPVFGAFTQTALYEDTAYDQTITATGSPTPTITSSVTSGSLPGNMTLDGARLYSTGNPRIIADAGTTFSITYTATATGHTPTTRVVNFTIAPNRLPVFDSFAISSRFLTENTAYDQSVTATGVPTPTITYSVASGSIPTGITITGGRIHGTPTGIPDSGVFFTIDFTATSGTNTATLRISFYVNNAAPSIPANTYTAPAFNTFTQTSLTEGVAYNQTITATGNPTPTITSEIQQFKQAQVFYMRPSDGTLRANYRTDLDTWVKSVREDYAREMNRHGYGRQTFELNTDSNGVINIELVQLPETEAQILARLTRDNEDFWHIVADYALYNESSRIYRASRFYDKINIFMQTDIPKRQPYRGVAFFPPYYYSIMSHTGWAASTIRHELGHSLGLTHEDGNGVGGEPAGWMNPGSAITLTSVSAKKINDNGRFLSSGTLPNGLILNGATLSGTPATGTAGSFTVVYTATSNAGTVKRVVTYTIGT